MTSACPYRYKSETDSEYQQWFRHILVLKPSSKGTTLRDYVRLHEDFKAAIEARMLSDVEKAVQSSLGGRELTIQDIKDVVGDIILQDDEEWIRGCEGIVIMHHPDASIRLVSALSKLPMSPERPEQKLMSIPLGGQTLSFIVRTHENRFMPSGKLSIWLDNPTEPAAEVWVDNDQGDLFKFQEIYASKEHMERFALISFCRSLISCANITPDNLETQYEPLGQNTFPDFELLVGKDDWAVEVTRIESDMVAYLRMDEPFESDAIEKVIQTEVTDSKINEALARALDAKTKKLTECSRYTRGCLLLVDVVNWIDIEYPSIWNDVDISAFEVIAVVKLDGEVFYVRGADAIRLST